MKIQLYRSLLISLIFSLSLPINVRSQGTLEGFVSCFSGSLLQPVIVQCGTYTDTTNASGFYHIKNIPAGSYDVYVYEPGGPSFLPGNVTIVDDMTTNLDISIPCGNFSVSPMNIDVTLEPNATTTETLTLSNTGYTSVDWAADVSTLIGKNPDDLYDVIFQTPLTTGTSEVGVACDDNYIYITSLYSINIYRYSLNGEYIDNFSVPFVTGIFDLTWDGNYFYGSTGSNIIYQMDFDQQTLINFITAPEDVSAITYDFDDELFYGYDWGSDVIVFDQSGTLYNTIPLGINPPDYVGFAYDNSNEGEKYIWASILDGTNQNIITQIELSTFQPTGLTLNLNNILTGTLSGSTIGLFTSPDIANSVFALGGVVQGEWLWAIEIGEENSWLTIDSISGTLAPGDSIPLAVHCDASDLIPWIYEGEIQFETSPDVGSPSVPVTMSIEGPPIPYNLQAEVNCVTVSLNWEMSDMYYPPVTYNIYRDDELIANVPDKFFADTTVYPEESYQYEVTAVFTIGETFPTNPADIMVPTPDSIEPQYFTGIWLNNNVFIFIWENDACLDPEHYNIYKDGELIQVVYNTTCYDTLQVPGIYEYFATAVYYFGESGPSNSFFIDYPPTLVKETVEPDISIFPIPANNSLFIHSGIKIDRIILFDPMGRQVNFSNHFENQSIDVSGYKPGLYYLLIKSGAQEVFEKVLIE